MDDTGYYFDWDNPRKDLPNVHGERISIRRWPDGLTLVYGIHYRSGGGTWSIYTTSMAYYNKGYKTIDEFIEGVKEYMANTQNIIPVMEWENTIIPETGRKVWVAEVKRHFEGKNAPCWAYQIKKKDYLYWVHWSDENGRINVVGNEKGWEWFGTLQEAQEGALADLQGRYPNNTAIQAPGLACRQSGV